MPRPRAKDERAIQVRLNGIPAYGIMLASIAYVIEITTFPMILNGMAASIGVDENTAPWLVSVYSVALVISVVIGGWLGDKLSREVVFAIGTSLFCGSAIAVLFAQTMDQALIFRIMQGVGAGLFSPMVPALLAARKPNDPIAALGFWGMLTGAAAACYPFIASLLTEEFSWHVGWMMVPAAAALALFGLPSPRDVTDYSLVKDTVAETKEKPRKMGPKVWAIMVYVFLNYGMTTWFIVALSLTFDGESGSFTTLGFILFLLWAVFSFGNYIISRIGRRTNIAAFLNIGVISNLIGIVIFCGFDASVMTDALAAIFIGAGMALNNAPTTDFAFRLSHKAQHGRIASMDIIAARLGGALFILVIPASGLTGFYAAIVATVLSLLLTAYCVRPRKKSSIVTLQTDQAYAGR
ncbi:MFS transporter [Parasulfitobacter algicola]|uniref:MFS transporter n=1 Tax=Parasulfitobacter algicola TaxID=2614809 RepID=A0ABX2IYZ9_9RHOB|nr:MFS transporter [Sulfitobacter algicola]NSX55899.1 MFS transporter [Sulfitobacter algicola]